MKYVVILMLISYIVQSFKYISTLVKNNTN